MPNPLVISIQLETNSVNSQIGGVNKALGGIGDAADGASRRASQGLNSLERSASRASISIRNQFSALRSIIQTAVGVGFAELAKSAVQVAASFELAELGIASFVQRGESAGKVFNDLKQFALTSPLQFSTVLEASNQLLATGTAAKDLIPTLKTLSTAMYAVTGGKDVPDKLKDVIRALSQIKAVGALTGEEMRQLQNAAIVTRAELARAFGVTGEEFERAIADRMVPADELIKATLTIAEARFGKFGDAVQKSATVAFSNFTDAAQQAADKLLRDYLPDIVQTLGTLTKSFNDFAESGANYRQSLLDIADALASIGTALITYQTVVGLGKMADKIADIASKANAFGLIAAGIAFVVYWTNRNVQALEDMADAQKKVVDSANIRDLIAQGKTAEDLKKLGYSLDIVKDALTGVSNADKAFDPSTVQDFGITVVKESLSNIAKLRESKKAAEEEAKKIRDAEKRALDLVLDAQAKSAGGLESITLKWAKLRDELGLTAKALINLRLAERAEVGEYVREQFAKEAKDALKLAEESFNATLEYGKKRFKLEDDFRRDTIQLGLDASQTLLANDERAAVAAKDAQLRQLELLSDQTLESRLVLEQRRAAIEEKFIVESNTRKQRNLLLELSGELENIDAIGRAQGLADEDLANRRAALGEIFAARARALALEAEEAIANARETAAIRSIQAVQSNNLRVFEGLKRNVEGLFDAVVTRSKSFGEAIADAIKLPILAAFKEIVSTRIAAFLFEIFGGGKVGIGQGGQPSFSGGGISVNTSGRNILGRLLGIGGAGALGFGGIPGAPGGTSGFSGPVQSIPGLVGVGTQGGGLVIPGLGGAGGVSGGAGGVKGIGASLSGAAGSLKGILASLGNLGRDGAVLGPGSNGGALAQSGVGGVAGGALLLGGGLLGFLGLRRGGTSGLGLSIAGGALAGAKFGVAGALIGAGIGAVAGTIRLFVKGAEEKIVEKVKAAYGITISKSFARDPLLGIIKQTFGGDINVGIQSQQVRDLIELYAMSTGQSVGSLPRVKPISSGFSLSGGGLSQLPSYSNGQPLSLGQLPGTSNPTPQPVVVQLDPESTTAFLQGQAVESINNNPRVVQGAVISASRQNAGRRQSLALAINPGVLL